MARGQVRKRNGKYYVDYFLGTRRIRKIVGTNKEQAQRILNKRLNEVDRGEHPDIFKSKIKFEDFAKQYETYSKGVKRSWDRNGKISLNRLGEEFDGKLLSQITPEMVEQYRRKRKAKVKILKHSGREKILSDASVNRELACLKAMFNKAVQSNYVSFNPVTKVKLASEKHCARARYLSKEEVHKLLSNCGSKLRAIVTVALNTGMRKGEMQNLSWDDIFYEQNLIRLRHTKVDPIVQTNL